MNRDFLDFLGAVKEPREITVKISTHNVGSENRKESNQNFGANVLLFLHCNTFSPTKGMGDFLKYIEDAYNLRTKALGFSCLEIGLECANAEGLKSLRTDYESGHLSETAERCFLTDEITEHPQMKDITVKTVIKYGEYFASRNFFLNQRSQGKELLVPVNFSLLRIRFFEMSRLVLSWKVH